MRATPLPDLVLYTRPGCGLCDETRLLLQALLEERATHGRRVAGLQTRDISTDPELEKALFDRIPVVELNGHRLELATSAAALRRFLTEALDEVLA